ncbi:ABC transporter permease [Homoserinibacter sp. GY 40078]|uniref:ABC transporter permease n=1 Tax=Homoserinibacter sp. GY 40078 TaxID=2603275 RepID=UPI0011C8B9D2|nr:ABC transporter permease [Homoserinibacter sp. GY 40078]TXK19536.1 ABC transporter permease [Homoserinibacter sp. GY 40078]
MNTFSQIWTIASIELRQRVRGVAWYVLLAVFVVIVLVVTVLTTLATSNTDQPGAVLYSIIVYFVLLLGTLVAPALSGTAINGDRENGTLATTQVTLVTTTQLVLGKLLAAWITALGFLVAALPFLIFALALGGASPDTAVVSILVLAVELGVVAAVGVGLSGLIRRPLFSVVTTYLVVAALSVGTLIAFGLGGFVGQERVTVTNEYIDWSVDYDESDPVTGLPEDPVCVTDTYEQPVPRFDRVWWTLAANPYVLLADAVPIHFDTYGNPKDVFGSITYGVRSSQSAPEIDTSYSECDGEYSPSVEPPSAREVIENSVPSWAVGLALHLALAVALILGAISRTHAPSRRLAAGSRIA